MNRQLSRSFDYLGLCIALGGLLFKYDIGSDYSVLLNEKFTY